MPCPGVDRAPPPASCSRRRDRRERRRLEAERRPGEQVEGAVGPERMHECPRPSIPPRLAQRMAGQVPGAAGEGQRPVGDTSGRLVDVGLGRLNLGIHRLRLGDRRVVGRERGVVLVDQPTGAIEDGAHGGDVDRVLGQPHHGVRVVERCLTPPAERVDDAFVCRLGDAE